MKKLGTTLLAALTILIAATSCKNTTGSESHKPGFIIQVSMGEWSEQFYSTEDVIARIEEVTGIIPVEKVLVGWSYDNDAYKRIGEYLHGKGIQMLLYLPVFAETEEVCDNAPGVDLWGNPPTDYIVPQGSGFRFNCPWNQQNIDNIIGIYEKYFAGIDFDGVFLDRIRTQSFVCGVQGVLNCGCDECAAYYTSHGVNLQEVRSAYETKGDKFFNVTSYDPVKGFSFEDPVAAKFFKVKGELVSGGVAKVCDYFRDKGMIVGLDLYAPLMAQFVGQDYSILAKHCDFIKPMLYRMTWAPAGIGFEYDLLKKSIPQAEGYPEIDFNLDFLKGQLDAMKDLPCQKYPGIEIIYDAKLAPTTPEYIIESLNTVIDYNYEGAVVSWNIMKVPNDHIQCLNQLKK